MYCSCAHGQSCGFYSVTRWPWCDLSLDNSCCGVEISSVIQCWALLQRFCGPRTLMRHNATAPAVICLILFPAVLTPVLCKQIRSVFQLHHVCNFAVPEVSLPGQLSPIATKTCLHAVELFACHRLLCLLSHPVCCLGALSRHQRELVNLTAKEAVARLCSGQITASEYTSSLLAQIELHACLNNFAALEPEKVWPFVMSIINFQGVGSLHRQWPEISSMCMQ